MNQKFAWHVENFAWCSDNCKGTKIFGLYVFIGFIVIGNTSLSNQNFHDKIKLWHLKLEHVSERCFVELSKQVFLGNDKFKKQNFVFVVYQESNIE